MTKVVIIGAGSASFGLETLSALMNSAKLRGSHLALVDRNPDALDLMARLAGLRLQNRWGGWDSEPFTATSSMHVSVYGR